MYGEDCAAWPFASVLAVAPVVATAASVPPSATVTAMPLIRASRVRRATGILTILAAGSRMIIFLVGRHRPGKATRLSERSLSIMIKVVIPDDKGAPSQSAAHPAARPHGISTS